jgi:hypothetical protein
MLSSNVTLFIILSIMSCLSNINEINKQRDIRRQHASEIKQNKLEFKKLIEENNI